MFVDVMLPYVLPPVDSITELNHHVQITFDVVNGLVIVASLKSHPRIELCV
jgi:hypothetical protein